MNSVNPKDLEASLDGEGQARRSASAHPPVPPFLRLIRLVLKHPLPLVVGFLMIFFGTGAALLEPRLFGWAIDEAILPKRWERLQMIGGFFIAVTCIRAVAAIHQGYFFELLGQRVTQDLRVMLFAKLQRMPIETFDRNPAGRLLTRVTNDIAALNEMFSAGFVSMICNILMVIGIIIWLFMLNFHLALIALSVFPALITLSIMFSRRLKVAYGDSRVKLSALNSFLAENLSGMKMIQLFNRQKLHLSRFNQLNHAYSDAQTASIRVFALFQPTITISAGISIALIIGFGGRETLSGHLKLGVLVAYFSYLLSLFQPVREIADKWNTFLSGMTSAERVFEILDWPVEILEGSVETAAESIPDLVGRITFERVWFAYREEDWVLKDFSLDIQAGEKIGVVGHTGAGKTTLISLLMRFYDPQRGRILLDGKDLRDYDPRALRGSIGIVQQEVFLFSGSFEDNITFWKTIEPQKIQSILSSLGFRRSFQEVLQERGSNFSMGERQIIAFARAMVSNPKIWILDEATANMDSETEAQLQRCLDLTSVSRTSILIAHRLATVRSADRIVVLHRGSLIEDGNHDILVKKNGLYARLYRYQEAQESCVVQSV